MTVAGLAMKGPALTWWLRWYPRHPWVNWDAFTSIFLWQFKPEWRVILPVAKEDLELEPPQLVQGGYSDEQPAVVNEKDLDFEPQQWVQGDSVDEQSTMMEERINDFNQHSSSTDVADLEIAASIKDSTVQSQLVSKTSFMNEYKPLFCEPENQDGDNTTRNQGLSLKLIIPAALDFVSQARMRNSLFRMSLNPFLDERKVVPMSVYANLDVDITGIQHDSRFVPPDKLNKCNVVEILVTDGITTTNCSTKSVVMMLHFMVDFCCFNGKYVTHNINTKGSYCEFVTLVANTLSSAMSRTKPLEGGLFSMGCTMASPWEEFARQYCSHIYLMTTSPLCFKEEVVMNLALLRWFYSLYVPPVPLDRLILKLDFLSPAKPPDPYLHIEDDAFMVLHNQLFLLVFTIESRLQVTKVICNALQQDLFRQQLGCTQPNNVKARSSTKYITVQVMQLVAIFAVTVTFITIPCLLKFTSDMNLQYKKGLLNPLLTYDVGSYLFVQNLFTHVFSWCGFVRMVYKHFVISKTCELKWLLIEIERNNFSIKLVTLVLTNSACSKLKEVDGSEYIDRYITVGVVVPYLLVKNTLIDMVVACGGINTIEGVFHIGLGMAIKPFVTLGRSTWEALNLFRNVIFNSIIVDDNECEKATWLKIGISSKLVVNIVFDLEDKITFREVGNDMINVVLIPCLFTNMLSNEVIIFDIKVVEVEMKKRIGHKRMLLSSWSDALEFYLVQIMDPVLKVDSLNSQIFFTHYHDYYIVGNGTWWQIKTKNMLTQGQFEKVCAWDNPCGVSFIIGTDINDPGRSLLLLCVLFMRRIHATHSLKLGQVLWSSFDSVFAHMDQVNNDSELSVNCTDSKVLTKVGHASTCDLIPISCAHFEQWDPGQQLGMSTTGRSFKMKQWDPGKIISSTFFLQP